MRRRTFMKSTAAAAAMVATNPAWAAQQTKMMTRKIPSTGEKLPALGFGTWQTFDVGADAKAHERLAQVLDILFDAGGSLIDSSPMYGSSEAVVGKLLSGPGLNRSDAFLATKVWTRGKEAGIAEIEKSFRLMAAGKQMELMQVHNLVDWQTQLKTVRAMKERGEVKYIGLTHYTDSGIDQIVEILQKGAAIDFVQTAYSVGVRHAEKKLYPLCRDKGIATIVNRPFEGGAAFRQTKGKSLPDWAAEFGARSWAQLFLKFALGNPAVTCVIPGTGRPEHARDNVGAAFGRLPNPEERKRIIKLWDSIR